VFLQRRRPGREVDTVIQNSPQAAASRDAAVRGREHEFHAFCETFSLQEIIDVAALVMRENSVPATMLKGTIERLAKTRLSESRKKLAFTYTSVFTMPSTRAFIPNHMRWQSTAKQRSLRSFRLSHGAAVW